MDQPSKVQLITCPAICQVETVSEQDNILWPTIPLNDYFYFRSGSVCVTWLLERTEPTVVTLPKDAEWFPGSLPLPED